MYIDMRMHDLEYPGLIQGVVSQVWCGEAGMSRPSAQLIGGSAVLHLSTTQVGFASAGPCMGPTKRSVHTAESCWRTPAHTGV